MFFEKGWVPLVRVFYELHEAFMDRDKDKAEWTIFGNEEGYGIDLSSFEEGDSLILEPPEFDEITEEEALRAHLRQFMAPIYRALWEMLEYEIERENVGVTSMNGSTLQLDKEIIRYFDLEGETGYHVCLSVGTVGSAAYDREYSEKNLHNKYGPFLHCPIVIREPAYRRFSEKMGTLDKDMTKSGQHDRVVAEIIRRFDSGGVVTKKWVRDNLARDMKVVEFLETWKMAATLRPLLSKSGPKGPR